MHRAITMIKIRLQILMILLLLILSAPAFSQDRAFMMKAAFIAKFAQFTEWPNTNEGSSHNEFIITVIGNDPIHSVLQQISKTKRVKNRTIVIRNISKPCDIKHPHVLYITKSMAPQLNMILEQVRGRSVMTISDTKGFGHTGVLINFYITDRGTLHFEINSTVLKQTSLKINLLLLEIARVIR